MSRLYLVRELIILALNLNIIELYLIQNTLYLLPQYTIVRYIYYKNPILYFNLNFCVINKIAKITLNNSQSGNLRNIFNDPDLNRQWYFVRYDLHNYYLSHELDKIWVQGIQGMGITIAILGDGMDFSHSDLYDNFRDYSSYNFINNTKIIGISKSSKTTISAGLISAMPNNYVCGVGAAPYAKISSLQIYEDEIVRRDEEKIYRAIKYMPFTNYIYVFLLNENRILDLKQNIKLATLKAIKKNYMYGRNQLGSIYVMGSGNMRKKGNNCAFNGFVQLAEVLVFGGILYNGLSSSSSERCNAIVAAALTSESSSENEKLYSTSSGDACGNSAYGSMTAASIGAGILALLISSNHFLSVRQILFLIILTSIQYDHLAINNAGGYSYSYSLGFGMINAEMLIELSKMRDINYLASENTCYTYTFFSDYFIKKNSSLIIYIYTSGCLYFSECITEVEHTFFIFSMTAFRRNSIKIFLTSPGGTRFKIIEPRAYDNSQNGFNAWKLKLMGYFGENPLGVWKLEIYTNDCSARLLRAQLIFQGTCVNPFNNFYSNEKIIKYICMNYMVASTNLQKLVCQNNIIMNNLSGYDSISFTGADFNRIEDLNTFL